MAGESKWVGLKDEGSALGAGLVAEGLCGVHGMMQRVSSLVRVGLPALLLAVSAACEISVDGDNVGVRDPGGEVPRGASASAASMPRSPEPPPRSVRDGVYSEEQAARGRVVYESECAQCHGDALLGGGVAPALVGAGVIEAWDGRSVGTLYAMIRTTMPAGAPATLCPQKYIDIVAYVLQANGFAAGAEELSLDDRALLRRTVFSATEGK